MYLRSLIGKPTESAHWVGYNWSSAVLDAQETTYDKLGVCFSPYNDLTSFRTLAYFTRNHDPMGCS